MPVNQQIAVSILAATAVLGLLAVLSVAVMIGMAWRDFRTSDVESYTRTARPSGVALVWRAIARKCPVCGRGAITRSVFWMNQACSSCQTVFWRNEGEWIGPVVISYTAALLAVLASWAVLTFFDLSEATQIVVPGLAAVAVVAVITPWSHSFWTLFLYLTGEIRQGP